MRIKIDIFKKTVLLNFAVLSRKTTDVIGVHNKTIDGKFCLFLDYDKTEEQFLKSELEHLQMLYDLGNIYIFKSSEKGFHAVSFVKLKAHEFMEIMQNSTCDWAFKQIPRFTTFRSWILRSFEKGDTERPKYLYTLKRESSRELSEAHYRYFKKLYPEIEEDKRLDGIKDLFLIKYKTRTNINA